MRKLYVSAALVALALFSCTKEMELPAPEKEQQPQAEKVWTVTMEATKAEKDPETKALLLSDDEKEIDFHWAGTDEVEVYDADGNLRGTMTPELAGSTTTNTTQLKGTIDGDYSVGETYTLYFLKKPAAENAYAAQKGTVADIAENFDYATASVKVKEVDSVNKTVVFSHAAFESQQSITKFIFRYSSGTPGDIRQLTILAPGRMDPVTVIPANPAMEFHVALPRIDFGGEKIVYTFLAETQNGDIYEGTKKAALQAGKYYRATVGLAKYDPIATPLTIEALEDGVITISNPLGRIIRWNAQGEEFYGQHAQSSDANPIEIPVAAGQRVILGGTSSTYATGINNYTNIRCSARHYMYGNVMSLISISTYAKPQQNPSIQAVSDRAFCGLFSGNDDDKNNTLYNHPVKTLALPALTVGKASYYKMFFYCTSLETAPELPATSFSGSYTEVHDEAPYGLMFAQCVALKKGPSILPAKTVSFGYLSMFSSCKSLKASPVLPDESPANWAYNSMFVECRSLEQITCYARNNLYTVIDTVWVGSLGYQRTLGAAPNKWVGGVAATGVFIKDPRASWPIGDNGIPKGWTYDKDPLIIEAIEDGTININNPQGLSITYSKDPSMAMGTTSSLSFISIPVSKGDKVRFWGDNPVYSGSGMEYLNTTFSGTAPHYVYGDIRSLVSSGNFPNVTSLEAHAFSGLFAGNVNLRINEHLYFTMGAAKVGERAFQGMFSGCTGIRFAPELPATTLGSECYANMFSDCNQLRKPPVLPATKLAAFCYSGMFSRCIRLQDAPELPATNLAEGCYMNMFDNCRALASAPKLKAAKLVPECYAYMFRDCALLGNVTCLATNPGAGYTDDWLSGVPSSGTFVKKSGVSWPSGSSGIPSGWTVQQSQ